MKISTAVASLLMSFVVLTTPHARGDNAKAKEPAALLARAREVMGFSEVGARVMYGKAGLASEQNYESDRTYPPYFSAMSEEQIWFAPDSGVLRIDSKMSYPGAEAPPSTVVDDGENAAIVRGDKSVPISRRQARERALNAWAVIHDWSSATGVRIAGTETYRDYPRVVLERSTPQGQEQLFLDEKSGFPVKLDRTEPHYLWGQQHVEYLWSTWVLKDGVVIPGAAFRIADGGVELSQTVHSLEIIPSEKAPTLAKLEKPAQVPPDLPRFLQAIPPQSVQVTPNVWLLSNPGYNEAVALVNGQIYVFDATQGEERAREDAAKIAQLFPGEHKVNVVVTDLAWPHVAGVRYWVSQGATIISHPAARSFLQRVVDRKWTLAPDSLEQLRMQKPKAAQLDFVPFDKAGLPRDLLEIIPIDGIGSEVALMAYLPREKFLWASDYVQTTSEPSLYANEVLRAAERAGIKPERVAAEHIPLTDWTKVQAAQAASPEQSHSSD